ncbi:MAG TPA: CPBP family intramembrane glutamic endopeptidase [Polyangiaceae bacterium]|nr:CPBP family intramembrane glutamic endopeptidase [Polyangiaceae bacterium]
MKPLGALLWTAACHGLFQLVAHGLSLARGTLDIVTLGAAQALAYLLGIFFMLRTFEPGVPLRQSLGLRPTNALMGAIGVGLGLCLKLPAEALTRLAEGLFPTSEGQLAARAALYRTDTVGEVLALVLVLCMAAPLVEELLFRGAAYGRLAKAGPRSAALVTGAAFVVVHPDLRHWPALLVVAGVLSYLRLAGGSLLPCLGLHVAFNAAGVLALVLGAASATQPLELGLVPVASSVLAAGALIMLSMRVSQNPEALRARAADRV